MMSTSRSGDLWLGALLAALASTTACQKTDPLFCCLTTETCAAGGSDEIVNCTDPDHPFCDDAGAYGLPGTCIADPAGQCDPACTAAAPVCEDGTSCGPCESSVDCAPYAGTPVCDAQGDGACVECVTTNDCGADGDVCRDDRTCGPCTEDAQCDSEVCDEAAGACVDAANVIYLDPAGTNNPTCDAGAPCQTFEHALTLVGGARDTIKARAGTYSENVEIDGALSVSISGPGAELSPASLNTPAILVTGSVDVRIDGLTVTGAGGGGNGDGIRCTDGGGSPVLTLSVVGILGNGAQGIEATNCEVSLSRSTVSGNAGGGLSLSSSSFNLVNNMITENGSGVSTVGGVFLSQAAGTRRFEFNTLSGNVASGGIAAGVLCAAIATPIVLSSSIVYGNGAGDQVEGLNCSWNYSNIGPIAEAGTGNISSDPLFANPGSDDYHLMPGSLARNAARPDATLDVDFDGDSRPQDGVRDIGADEIAP